MPLSKFNQGDFNPNVLQYLGSGTYGNVYKLHLTSAGTDVVLKDFKPLSTSIIYNNGIYADLIVGMTGNHNSRLNRIGPLGFTIHESRFGLVYKHLYRSLANWKPTNINEGKSMIQKILHQLDAFHSMGFVHSDLKLENIMVDANGAVHLIDYGLSKYIGIIPYERYIKRDFLYTESFKAPDHPRNFGYLPGNLYNYNTDVYAVAQILGRFYGLLSGWQKFVYIGDRITICDVDHSDQPDNQMYAYPYNIINPDATPLINFVLGTHGASFIRDLIGGTTRRPSAREASFHPYLSGSQQGSGLLPDKVKSSQVPREIIDGRRIWFTQMEGIFHFYGSLKPRLPIYSEEVRQGMYTLVSDLAGDHVNLSHWVTDTILNVCRIGLGSELSTIQAWVTGEMLNSVFTQSNLDKSPEFMSKLGKYFGQDLSVDDATNTREFSQLLSTQIPDPPFLPYTSFIDYVLITAHIYGTILETEITGFFLMLYLGYMLMPSGGHPHQSASIRELTWWAYTRIKRVFQLPNIFPAVDFRVIGTLDASVVEGFSALVQDDRGKLVFDGVVKLLHTSGLEFPQSVVQIVYGLAPCSPSSPSCQDPWPESP